MISPGSRPKHRGFSALRRRDRALSLALATALGSPVLPWHVASAAEPPPAANGASFARARDLFFKGLSEQSAGNWERALALFLQSREAAPTWQSTMNAALCLGKLGRYEEALTTYEGLLASFAGQLDAAERARIDAAITLLEQKVVSLEITANVAARVLVDGAPRGDVPLGGPLLLRITADTHRVEIVKDGFRPFDRTRAFAAGATVLLYAELERAPAPPAPPTSPPAPQPHPSLSVFAGGVVAGSLDGTAERGASVSRHAPVGGFIGGIRGGYSFSIGLTLELTVGYLAAVSGFHRSVSHPSFVDTNPAAPVPLNYDLHDALGIRGPLLGLGASYQLPLDDRWSVLLRSTFGVLQARSVDPISGAVCAGSGCVTADGAQVLVRGNGQTLSSTSGFILPEIGLDARWGNLRADLSLGLFLLTADGPSFKGRTVGVDPRACTAAAPAGSVACAPNRPLGEPDPNDVLEHGTRELAYGGLALLWVPRIAVGYSF